MYTENTVFPQRAKEEYLAEKSGIIDQAKRGKLPEREFSADQEVAMKVARLVFFEKFDEAEKVLLNALSKDKKNTSLLYKLGHFYYDTGRTEKFSKVMHRIIEIDPKHDRALNLLGYALAEQGKDLDKAESFVRRALEIQPESGAYLDSLGWVLYKKGDYKKANEYLEKAAGKRSSSPTVLGHLAETQLKMGQCEKAVETYRQALKKSTEKRKFRTIFR